MPQAKGLRKAQSYRTVRNVNRARLSQFGRTRAGGKVRSPEYRVRKIAVIADFIEEKWPSMDLVAEQLAAHLGEVRGIEAELVRLPLRVARSASAATGIERALGRFAQLPLELSLRRLEASFVHIADHSYAHLAFLYPRARVGVYCHDIDAFRALLPESRGPRSRQVLSRLLLQGLRHAHVVFHSTQVVRNQLLEHGLVPADRLVHAPYGVADEYLRVTPVESARAPYLLHVGSCIPRKNVELLLRVFARASEQRPELRLIQVGGRWTEEQGRFIAENGIGERIEQRRGISRAELAEIYAAAAAVLVTSTAEGFGLPVIEALACGTPVIASDIPVLREVGFQGVEFCPLAQLEPWLAAVSAHLARSSRVSGETRAQIHARYTWQSHARTVAEAYAGKLP